MILRTILGFITAGLAACLAVTAATVPAHAATINSTTLRNGLQVRTLADQQLPLVRVAMVFAAGRANDPDSLAGLAHFAEHLLTESSPAYPEGGLIRQSTLYATYRNAHTGSSFMGFETECLPEFLPRILNLEVERLRGAVLDEAGFAREKAIVMSEQAYRKRRPARAKHLDDLTRACYPGHPLGATIGGSRTSVGRITLADVEKFHRDNIVPRRAVLVIEGPVDTERTLALVDSLFGGGPPARPEHLELPAYPAVTPTQFVGDTYDFTGVRVSTACRVPLDEAGVNTVLAQALPYLLDTDRLGVGYRSVPGEILVLLTAHFIYNKPPKDPQQHYGYLYEDFDPDQSAQYALGHIWRSLAEEVTSLADAALFAERKADALANVGNLVGSAVSAIDAGAILVNGNSVLKDEEARTILGDLTYGQLTEFVDNFINPARAGVGITHGRDSERQQALELAKRESRDEDPRASDALARLTAADIVPVMAAYRGTAVLPVAQTTLANGVPFIYLELPGLTQIRLGGCRVLPPLKAQRPGDKPGIAHLYSRVAGYDDRQRRDLDDTDYRPKRLPFEFGIELQPGLLRYEVTGPPAKVGGLAFHLDRRLESHDFNQERWSRVLRFGHDLLGSIAADPAMQATGWRIARICGEKFPTLGYWQPSADTVEKIRYKDLVKLHEQVAGETGQTVVYGVGSVPLGEVAAELESTLGRRGTFHPFDEPMASLAEVTGIAGHVVTDPTRGDVLLSLTFPLTSPPRRPSLASELLLQTLLQQALTSRLREREGLTYGVWAERQSLSGQTLHEIHVTCRPGQSHLVLPIVREEVRRYTMLGFEPDEMARARLALTGDLIRTLSDAEAGFALLGELAVYGAWPEDLMDTIASLDLVAINSLTAQVLDADRFAFTVLGPRLEEDLELFNLD